MTNQEILDQIAKFEKGLSNPNIPESTKGTIKGKIEALKAQLEKVEDKVEKKEEKLQAEEKKIQSELEENIAKWEKGLSNPNIPASAKDAIKRKIAAAKEEVAKQKAEIKEDVKESAKETKEIKAAVKKLAEVAKKAGKVKTARKSAAPKESKEEEREKKSEKRQSKLKGMMADLEALIHKNKYLASKYEGKHVNLDRDAKRPAKPFGYRFVGKGDYRVPTAEQIKEGKKTGKIDYEGRPNRADKGPKKEYKLKDGGDVDNQNAEMVLSKAKELKHHADELENNVSRNSKVDAWEVAKMERAATDASDVTHYEDGKAGDDKYFAKGGRVLVGKFDEKQLKNGEDKKAIEKKMKETGLKYIDNKIIKKNGKPHMMEVYLYAKGGETGTWYKEGSNKWGLEKTDIYIQENGDKFDVYTRDYDNKISKWKTNVDTFDTFEEAKKFGFNQTIFAKGGYMAKGGEVKRPYKLGDKWRDDFDYEGMLKQGLKSKASWGEAKLRKLFNSYEDVNYHTASAPLWDAIQSLKNDKKEEAENHIEEFHKRVKAEMDDIDFTMKKGGKLSTKAKYIPKYKIEELTVDKNGKEVEIDGADLLDGVYVKKGKKMAYGGMTPGRYYKDNKGEEYRFIGESDGKLLFKDGETVVTKTESDFEEEPREKKLFKFFAEGGTVNKMERKAKAGAKKVVKAVSSAGKVSVSDIAKLAKSIRKEGEKWTDAIKRAAAQLKK